MKRLMPVLALLALCSCGSKDPKATPTVAKGTEAPSIKRVTQPRSKELVQLERRSMGRWRSAPGVLAGSKNQWLLLDVAGTKDARLEVRNSDLAIESVTAFATGHVVVTHEGIDLRLPKADGTLRDFKNATGAIVTPSKMMLKSSTGREFELTYDGQ